jgi:prepilin-type N-terminal cleavage/methylation domain-containing protein
MCKFNSKMGFTLIELMVVIVIIGVLASLAIPRFTEASDKAKVAEAPRVLASYESAQLAHMAEQSRYGDSTEIIFNVGAVNSDSKWFGYEITLGTDSSSAEGTAAAKANLGKIKKDDGIKTELTDSSTTVHSSITDGGTDAATIKKYLPNFFRGTES